jgi:hypothetical protein
MQEEMIGGKVVTNNNAQEYYTSWCSEKFHYDAAKADSCAKKNLASYKNKRRDSQGLYQSLKKSIFCGGVDIAGDYGNLTILFDPNDKSETIAELVARHFDMGENADMIQTLQNHFKLNMNALANDIEAYRCLESHTRRNWLKLEEEMCMKPVLDAPLLDSAVSCTHPFQHQEWMLTELNAFIPLGTCEYRNLYVHNNEFYFVSDGAEILPQYRLNTATAAGRPVTVAVSPKVVSRDHLRMLMRNTFPLDEYQLIKVRYQY